MDDNILKQLKGIEDRLRIIEQNQRVTSTTYPTDTTLVIPVYASDPVSGIGGQIYYNSVTGVFRKYDDVAGSWKAFNTA